LYIRHLFYGLLNPGSENRKLCQSISNCVSPCQIVSVRVKLCQSMSNCVSPCQIVSVRVKLCQSMSNRVSPCQIVSVHVKSCQSVSNCVGPCQINKRINIQNMGLIKCGISLESVIVNKSLIFQIFFSYWGQFVVVH